LSQWVDDVKERQDKWWDGRCGRLTKDAGKMSLHAKMSKTMAQLVHRAASMHGGKSMDQT